MRRVLGICAPTSRSSGQVWASSPVWLHLRIRSLTHRTPANRSGSNIALSSNAAGHCSWCCSATAVDSIESVHSANPKEIDSRWKPGKSSFFSKKNPSRPNKCNWKINESKWWVKFSTASKYWNCTLGKSHLCVDWTMSEKRNYSAFERKRWLTPFRTRSGRSHPLWYELIHRRKRRLTFLRCLSGLHHYLRNLRSVLRRERPNRRESVRFTGLIQFTPIPIGSFS